MIKDTEVQRLISKFRRLYAGLKASENLTITGEAVALVVNSDNIADAEIPLTKLEDAVYTSAQVDSGFQPKDADLTAIAALTTTTFGRALLTLSALGDLYSLLATQVGSYTPTLTNVTNLGASTPYQAQYFRLGVFVIVTGKVDVDPTAAGDTKLGISLPIASNFANDFECGGVAFSPGIAGQGAGIHADATNDRAQMRWVAVDTTNQSWFYVYGYQIVT